MLPYRPEGLMNPMTNPDALHRAVATGEIFQATCLKCDEFHNLHVDLGTIRGVIPREETAIGIEEGSTKAYAILSRVGKPVCFQVLGFDSRGCAVLSRRAAQADARDYFLSALHPGDVIPAVVLNAADFGVFCDIGCGFPALMRINRCCTSRLDSTASHFRTGQLIYVAVLAVDDRAGQVHLTGRELLGTWEENASRFRPGQTVPGIVRSVMSYGVFVELGPNLSGLAEPVEKLQPGTPVSVHIRGILPEKHKLKLNIIEILPEIPKPAPIEYFITSGHLDRWEYFPGSKSITVF